MDHRTAWCAQLDYLYPSLLFFFETKSQPKIFGYDFCVCRSLSAQQHRESKGGDGIGDRVLGARLHPGLTISENSAEVFATRFAPEGK